MIKKEAKIRFEELMSRFKNQKILVVGDIGIDRYIEGRVERISPEAPVLIILLLLFVIVLLRSSLKVTGNKLKLINLGNQVCILPMILTGVLTLVWKLV
jgi:hypothetical protein